MSKTIVTVINQKGGVGKSTTSASLACNIVRLLPAASVLLIDGDPQGDLSTLLKLQFKVDPVTTKDVLVGSYGRIWPSYGIGWNGRLSFSPSSFDLDNIEDEIRKIGDNLFDCVRRKLSPVAADYVIIDCSPSFRDLNKAFIAASDYVIIPTLPQPLSLPAVQRTALLVKMIGDAAKRSQSWGERCPVPQVLGILICLDERYAVNREAQKVLRNNYGNLVFDTTIQKTVLMQEDTLRGMLKDPLVRNTAAANFLDFTREVIDRIKTIKQENHGK